jgi:hypothetical protein
MKHALLVVALTVCLTGATSSAARADSVYWDFGATPTPTQVTGGNGAIGFSSEPMHGPKSIFGDTSVTFSSLTNLSTAPGTNPDTFSSSQGFWSIAITLQDGSTGTTGQLTISGQIQGYFSLNNAVLTNTFNNPGPITQRVGNTLFTLSDFTFTPVGPGTATQSTGAIGAYVQATGVPEPSALLLVGIGLGVLGTTSWRKRRR